MRRTANVPEDLTGRPRRVATGGVSWRKTFSAFQYRNYRLYFCGQLVSSHRHLDDKHGAGLARLSIDRFQGIVRHRRRRRDRADARLRHLGRLGGGSFPKRTVLIWTQSAMMIFAFVFAVLIWSGLIRPWEIIVLGLFGGVAMAFDMPARQSFVVEIASREDLLNAISLNSRDV